jgi:hypothetical protein
MRCCPGRAPAAWGAPPEPAPCRRASCRAGRGVEQAGHAGEASAGRVGRPELRSAASGGGQAGRRQPALHQVHTQAGRQPVFPVSSAHQYSRLAVVRYQSTVFLRPSSQVVVSCHPSSSSFLSQLQQGGGAGGRKERGQSQQDRPGKSVTASTAPLYCTPSLNGSHMPQCPQRSPKCIPLPTPPRPPSRPPASQLPNRPKHMLT